MNNKIFQEAIYKIQDFVDRTIGVVNDSKVIIACSDMNKVGQILYLNVDDRIESNYMVVDNFTCKSFGTQSTGYFYFFCEGTDEKALKYVNLISVTFSFIKRYEDDKSGRLNFIKNVVLDNILPGDVYIRAREMHFDNENHRVVLMIKTANRMDIPCYEVIRTLFPDDQKDIIFQINERETILVKEVRQSTTIDDIKSVAESIIDLLNVKYFTKSYIGIGSIVDVIKDLSRSFKEARIALEVGNVFDVEKFVLSYDNLGVGRLIYQLPTTVCDMFLREVFKKGSIESLDSETLFTIQKFFENNLNVSETSRGLFVHRNTLVYRLEKIRKITGLDLRQFDHAIIFKVALMVKKYLQSNPTKF